MFCIRQKQVSEERKTQIAFNEELKRQRLAEEQMFSKLWEADRLAKEKREAEEARRQKELVENTRLGLNAQITGIQAQRRAAQQLKEEEARLVVGFQNACPRLISLVGRVRSLQSCYCTVCLMVWARSQGTMGRALDFKVQLIVPSHCLGQVTSPL